MEKDVRKFCPAHQMNSSNTSILRASTGLVVGALRCNITSVINLKSINELKEINNFFCEVNNKLVQDGLFGCCMEPTNIGKQKISEKRCRLYSVIYSI